jgi:hypothetical protein
MLGVSKDPFKRPSVVGVRRSIPVEDMLMAPPLGVKDKVRCVAVGDLMSEKVAPTVDADPDPEQDALSAAIGVSLDA